MWALLIEDDDEMRDYVARSFREAGWAVDCEPTGAGGLEAARNRDLDLLVVDRMLPDMDGLDVVRSLRAAGVSAPALFLTALSEVEERVRGLRAGGDDYLAKPFAIAELLARAEALARRGRDGGATATQTQLRVDDLELDVLARQARRGGETLHLQPREFQLLERLMRAPGQVVTRTMLLESVWGYRFDPHTNVIDVHISRLRAKVDRGRATSLIHTVRGSGYMIKP